MRKIPEQENLMIKVRVYILWENARVYNREGNNHGAEVSVGMEGGEDPNKEHCRLKMCSLKNRIKPLRSAEVQVRGRAAVYELSVKDMRKH